MSTERKGKITSFVVGAALLLGGCSAAVNDEVNGDVSDTSTPEEVLRIGQTSGIPEVYTTLWQETGSLWQTLVFRSLFMPAANLTDVTPDLATAYSVSADGLSVEIVLTEDGVWQDGTPVSVDDVVWSLTTALKVTYIKSNYVGAFGKIVGGDAVIAGTETELSGISVSGSTINIELTQPVNDFIPLLGQFAIYPKHLLENADLLQLQNDPFWLNPVGNGMFKVEKFEPTQYITLAPSPTWTGVKPQIQRIEVTGTTDPVSDFEAGKIDYLITNDVTIIDGLESVDSVTKSPVNALFLRYFMVNANADNAPFDNPKVREAIIYAIDRATIVESLYRGAATVVNSGIPAGYPGYWSGAEDYAIDPELAKSMLEDEGFDFSRTIRLRYYYSDPTSKNFMTAIGQSLNDIGLTTDVQMFQGDATTGIWTTRDYDLAYKGLSAYSPMEWYLEYTGTRANAVWGDQSDIVDLVSTYSQSNTSSEQESILEDLQRLDQQKMLKLPLYQIGVFIYTSDRLNGVPASLGNPWWRYDLAFENWSVSK